MIAVSSRNSAKQAAAGDCGIKTPCDYRSRVSLVRKTAVEHLKRITDTNLCKRHGSTITSFIILRWLTLCNCSHSLSARLHIKHSTSNPSAMSSKETEPEPLVSSLWTRSLIVRIAHNPMSLHSNTCLYPPELSC